MMFRVPESGQVAALTIGFATCLQALRLQGAGIMFRVPEAGHVKVMTIGFAACLRGVRFAGRRDDAWGSRVRPSGSIDNRVCDVFVGRAFVGRRHNV